MQNLNVAVNKIFMKIGNDIRRLHEGLQRVTCKVEERNGALT
jgi:hypothetical protein